jgi:outer membrane receptor protein involved in Fe transport
MDDDALAAELNAALSQQIVSGASRTAETAEQAPVAATVIRAEDLRRYGIRTVAEALSFLSMGTFLLGGQISDSQTVGARGVVADGDSNNHFLVVVDGHPINQGVTDGAAMGYGLGIPISMIDSIEVILGPGSVVYGGNAMLGIINIRTKPGRQMHGVSLLGQYAISPTQTADGKIDSMALDSMGGSHRAEATVGKTFQFAGKEGEFTMGLVSGQMTLPTTTIAPQTPFANAPATAPRYGGDITMPLDSGHGGYGRLKIGNFSADASYVVGNWAWGTPAAQNLTQMPGYFDYKQLRTNAAYAFDLGSHLSGFAALRFMDYQHSAHRIGPAGSCPVAGTVGSRCFVSSIVGGTRESLELQGTYDFLADGRYQLMMGLDGRMGQAGGYAHTADAATGLRFSPDGGYDSDSQVFGAYAQFRGRPARWAAVNLGIRGDWIWDQGSSVVLPSTNPAILGATVNTNNSAVSPRAAVMLFPTDSTTAYASYSRAFRAPSTNELHFVSTLIEPASGLKPEIVDSGEVGVKQKLGVHRALASVFVEKRSGLIGFIPTDKPGKQKYSSVGDIENYGFNVGFDGSLDANRFHYGASFTYAHARRSITPIAMTLSPAAQAAADTAIPQSESNPRILGAPEWSGNLRLAYDFQGSLPEIAVAAVILGPRLTGFGYSGTILVPPATEGGTPTTQTVFGRAWRSNIDPFRTDTMVEARLHVGGPLPYVPSIRYTLMANYLFGPAFEPVAYGPTPGGSVPTTAVVDGLPRSPQSGGQLFPMTKLTLAAALQVNFD